MVSQMELDSRAIRRWLIRIRVRLSQMSTLTKVKMIAGALFVAYVYEQLLVLHRPFDASLSDMAQIAFLETNPRVEVSPGIELFTIREFSRVCCDYGPTIYRGSTFYERKFQAFGQGEKGYYDYGVALKAFLGSGKLETSIFVPSASLYLFITKFFLKLGPSHRVVLITGQEDCGPAELFGRGRTKCSLELPLTIKEFLGDERLKYWYAQNYDIIDCKKVPAFPKDCVDPYLPEEVRLKLAPIILGLDYHTSAEKTKGILASRVSPSIQEQQLLSFAKTPWTQRPMKVIAIFSAPPNKPDRKALLAKVGGKPCVIRPALSLPRNDFWDLHNDAAFVFNPQGNGIDTHRVYEALNLHSIPVVRSSPLDSLYAQLPIIILPSWATFTSCDQLQTWKEEILERFGSDPFSNKEVMQKLTLKYWKQQVASHLH